MPFSGSPSGPQWVGFGSVPGADLVPPPTPPPLPQDSGLLTFSLSRHHSWWHEHGPGCVHREPTASLGPPDSQALVPGIGCTLERGYVEALHSALQILVAVSAGEGRWGGGRGSSCCGPRSQPFLWRQRRSSAGGGEPLFTPSLPRGYKEPHPPPTCVAWATHSAKWAENQFQPQGWREDEPRGQNLKLLMMQWGRASSRTLREGDQGEGSCSPTPHPGGSVAGEEPRELLHSLLQVRASVSIPDNPTVGARGGGDPAWPARWPLLLPRHRE